MIAENRQKMFRIRCLLCILLVVMMTAAAELLGEKEIIFPEIAALLIGGIAADASPWKTNRIQMILLMTVAALAGIGIVRFLLVPVYFQVIVGMTAAAVCLTVSGTMMVPMISACVLPVLMQTETLVYPVSVFLMLLAITGLQWLLERTGKKPVSENSKIASVGPEERFRMAGDWGKRLAFFGLLAIVPISMGEYYFIAPPLIVAFVEMTNPRSGLRARPARVIVVMGAAAALGTAGRYLFQFRLHLPETLTAAVVMTGVLLLFSGIKLFFPPAGAAALLPLILQPEGLYWYPWKVAIGCLLLTAAAIVFFPSERVRRGRDLQESEGI